MVLVGVEHDTDYPRYGRFLMEIKINQIWRVKQVDTWDFPKKGWKVKIEDATYSKYITYRVVEYNGEYQEWEKHQTVSRTKFLHLYEYDNG
jgi:hypothetical protein